MRRRTRLGSLAAVVLFSVLASPLSATAQQSDNAATHAEGRFLAGTIAGVSLDSFVELQAALAKNDGHSPTAVVRNPVSVTALSAIRVASAPLAVHGPHGVTTGVLGQYARAANNGTSFASSGAIGSNGAIAVNSGTGGAATIDLKRLLGSKLTSSIANLSLSVKAVAAQAEAKMTQASGDYALAGLTLTLSLPALKGLSAAARDALAPVRHALAGLAGSSGPLAVALDRVLRDRHGALGILGTGANVSVTVKADLDAALARLGSLVLSDQALTIDLVTGTVTVDLAKLPASRNLNTLPVGTELLSGAVIGDITAGVTRLLTNHVNGIEVALLEALDKAAISVDAHLSLTDRVQTGERVVETVTHVTQVVDRVTGKVLGFVDPVTGKITSLVAGVTGADLRNALDGVLGGILAALLGLGNGVETRIIDEVTTTIEPVFELLETRVAVKLSGTAKQFRDRLGVSANVDLKVLGLTVDLDAAVAIGAIGGIVSSALYAPSILDCITGLDGAILGPVLAIVAGGGSNSLKSVLGDVLSVKANVQSSTNTAQGALFTQTALRVSVAGGLATVNLANATVGPNVRAGGPGDDDGPGGGDPTDPGDGDGGDPGDGNNPGDDDGTPPGNGGDDPDDGANPPSGGGDGSLADTGGLLAVLLLVLAAALTAAGVYLASRRRSREAGVGGEMLDELIP